MTLTLLFNQPSNNKKYAGAVTTIGRTKANPLRLPPIVFAARPSTPFHLIVGLLGRLVIKESPPITLTSAISRFEAARMTGQVVVQESACIISEVSNHSEQKIKELEEIFTILEILDELDSLDNDVEDWFQ